MAHVLVVASKGDLQHSPPLPTTQNLPPESLVFLINCLHALYNVLSRLEFTGTHITALATRLDEIMSELTQLQATHVFVRAGLQGLYEAMENPDSSELPLAQRGLGCSQAEVHLALVSFFVH